MLSFKFHLQKATYFITLRWVSLVTLSVYLFSFLSIISVAQTPFGFNGFNECGYNGTNCDGTDGTGVSNNGLKAWYDADSTTSYPGTGQIIYDLSGNGANGTFGLDSAVAADDPVFNTTGVKSFSFVNAREVISTSVLTNFSANFTLEAWFKRSSNTDSISACERLINMNSNVSNATRASLALCGKNIAARGRTTDNLGAWAKDTGFVANTEWHMATLTYNSTSQSMQVYVNGTIHSSSTQAILPGTNNNILIGGSAPGPDAQNFIGQIAVTRIYNRDLTVSEITSNFEGEKSRFGFSDSAVQISVPVSLNIGSSQVKSTSQQVTVTLANVAIVDRRSNFVPYTTSLAISDLSQGNQKISKNNIGVNFGTPVKEMGSGLNQTTGTGGSLTTAKNILTNTGNNGGGKLVYSPQITVTIPAFAKQGTYTAIITFSVS